jgi:hypothetical protein
MYSSGVHTGLGLIQGAASTKLLSSVEVVTYKRINPVTNAIPRLIIHVHPPPPKVRDSISGALIICMLNDGTTDRFQVIRRTVRLRH